MPDDLEVIKLLRNPSTPQGTFGHWMEKGLNLVTGELPWAENRSGISCIPFGKYLCRWTYSEHFERYMYEVQGVENRSGIRIHSANFCGLAEVGWKKELEGCISLGQTIGDLTWQQEDGANVIQKAVIGSRAAVRAFENRMAQKSFWLDITQEAS